MRTPRYHRMCSWIIALVLGLVLGEQAWAAPPVVDAYSKFRNGPVFIPYGDTQEVVHLDVTPGLYVIFAKGYAKVEGGGAKVECKLLAGAASDRVRIGVDTRITETAEEAFSLNVLQNFTSAGTIILKCTCGPYGDDVNLNYLRVTAMRVNSYWNLSE